MSDGSLNSLFMRCLSSLSAHSLTSHARDTGKTLELLVGVAARESGRWCGRRAWWCAGWNGKLSLAPFPAFPCSEDGCDRASAKDFHEIRAVFTRGVA